MMPSNMPVSTRISWRQNPKKSGKGNMNGEYDLAGFVCPLSKIKAAELIDNLDEGETARIILGDRDSLKSVAQELKTRGIKPTFAQDGENRFILTITK
ncbi:MAG: sulfurtransferase TusA family protein [Planctomycetes bacterium]|nr:sulfurtransferase TusA family protein [Planctomycetota bacterium]